ncbi:MAG: VanW family protein [Cyanobacteriota bacterium]|nr:VanW family protein [Cyanobacteriota bacterium]
MRWGLLGLLPVVAAAALGLTRVDSQRLSQSTTSLEERDASQRHNILQAATRLDGLYLEPGEIFSFNQQVGPRTLERGYLPAPAFMTSETVDSVGGGICQVSSSLYEAALRAGLRVIERHAHFTTVESVPTGLDATVWYGQADLRLQNPYPWPIRWRVRASQHHLIISLYGSTALPLQPLQRQESWRDPQHLLVSVYQGSRLISEDVYAVVSQGLHASQKNPWDPGQPTEIRHWEDQPQGD